MKFTKSNYHKEVIRTHLLPCWPMMNGSWSFVRTSKMAQKTIRDTRLIVAKMLPDGRIDQLVKNDLLLDAHKKELFESSGSTIITL